jgi:glutathione S-transferase
VRLYHVPGTRSSRVLWMLEEIGAPYDLTVMTREERQTPEHLQRHPLGRVPALEDDDGFVFESAALCLHLADLHPEAQLIPLPGTHERALAYQWTVFAMTELEPAIIEARRGDEDPARAEAGAERFQAAAQVVERALEGRDYLVGERFSVADLVCGGVLIFGRSAGLTDNLPNIAGYLARLDARPARTRATAIKA